MTMVTGDDFIRRLVSYLKVELKQSESKALSVRLNQQCLSYLAAKIADLEQQRAAGLNPSLGARVFRTLFPQHSLLSELEELLPLVQVLHLQPAPQSVDPGTRLRLGLLPSLQGLELHGLLGLAELEDLPRVRQYLKMLTLFQCAYDVLERLISGMEDQNQTLPEMSSCTGTDSHIQFGTVPHHCVCWAGLLVLHVNRCGIKGLGSSTLARLPNVEVINLSCNAIEELEDFNQCYGLRVLDLSKNQIRSCGDVHLRLGNVESLSLAANLLLGAGDLHRLKPLRTLNLSSNLLPSLEEVAKLQQLPLLHQLQLQGNPLDQLPRYRVSMAQCFVGRSPALQLDGTSFTQKELSHAHKHDTPVFPHACQRAPASGAPVAAPVRPRSSSKRGGKSWQEEGSEEAPVDRRASRWSQDLKTLREQYGDDYLVHASKLMNANNFFQIVDAAQAEAIDDPEASIAQMKQKFRETVIHPPDNSESPPPAHESSFRASRQENLQENSSVTRRDSDISL